MTPGVCQSCGAPHPPVKKSSQKVARCHCRGVVKFPNRERKKGCLATGAKDAKDSKGGWIVKMFMRQFAPLVESGAKMHTVRPTPKRMPKVGQRISLREWAGKPYRSKQRVLRESVITEVQTIWFNGVSICLDGGCLSMPLVEAFARADGFDNSRAMADWFVANHGSLPFEGILIGWK